MASEKIFEVNHNDSIDGNILPFCMVNGLVVYGLGCVCKEKIVHGLYCYTFFKLTGELIASLNTDVDMYVKVVCDGESGHYALVEVQNV